MICPKHSYTHSPGDICPALVYWKNRTGFSNIRTHRPWVKPWVRVERGAGAKMIKASFGVRDGSPRLQNECQSDDYGRLSHGR